MLAVALEDRVLADVDLDVEIPRWAAVASRLALTAQAHAVAVINARGDLDGELAGTAHAPLSETAVAGIAHHGTGAAAARAGLLQLEKALADAHLADAPAGFAGRRMAPLGSPAAVAHLAFAESRHLDLHLMTEHGLRQL